MLSGLPRQFFLFFSTYIHTYNTIHTYMRQMRKVQRHRSADETVELTTVVLQKTNNHRSSSDIKLLQFRIPYLFSLNSPLSTPPLPLQIGPKPSSGELNPFQRSKETGQSCSFSWLRFVAIIDFNLCSWELKHWSSGGVHCRWRGGNSLTFCLVISNCGTKMLTWQPNILTNYSLFSVVNWFREWSLCRN